MEWHSAELEEVYRELDTSPDGLSSEEAERRLGEEGPNELEREGGPDPLEIFLNQFRNVLVITLIIAAVISFFIGEALDAIVIGAILVLNAALGFVQDYRAERALEALKEMVKKECTVLRGGEKERIETSRLVPGDVVLLEAGDSVPADARLIGSNSLKTQEAALTGESVPVSKETGVVGEASVPERTNMVFMGTDVVFGAGKAVVASTGMDTELGNVAAMVQEEKRELPLQRKMREISEKLGAAALAIVFLVALTGIAKNFPPTIAVVEEMFIVAVALAVAAIPEGLPAVVTISLSLGVQRMVDRNAIIRRLPAVETLGSMSVICTDKTGTLTQNRMTVTRMYVGGERYEVTGVGYEPDGEFRLEEKSVDPTESETVRKMFRTGLLANNAELKERERWEVMGDPTEGALIPLAMKAGMDKGEMEERHERVAVIPFDSKRKRMSTVNRTEDGPVLHTKGAPEAVLDVCDRIMEGGRVREMRDEDRVRILQEVGEMASDALRLLAFAYRPVEERKQYGLEVEDGMIYLGLVGMIDPPREGIGDSIEKARRAGIRTIMVTGDNARTAEAIAEQVGLETEGAVQGKEMDDMSDERLREVVRDNSVFARVSPEHKVRIVEALEDEHVVGMTGDGVNDAPALNKADVGIAMGITGTDVSKEASDMVLVDDNYASIVAAVEEGRGVYDNIQKFVNYLLGSNTGEIFTLFFGILLFPLLPLLALHILWVNLVTDGLPAVALGADPVTPKVMDRPPAAREKEVLDRDTVLFLLALGTTIGLGTLAVFARSLPGGQVYARTMAFTTLVAFQLVNVFNCRTNESLFTAGVGENRYLILAVLGSLLAQLVLLYTTLAGIFGVVPLSLSDWLLIVPVSLTVIITSEAAKYLLDYSIID